MAHRKEPSLNLIDNIKKRRDRNASGGTSGLLIDWYLVIDLTGDPMSCWPQGSDIDVDATVAVSNQALFLEPSAEDAVRSAIATWHDEIDHNRVQLKQNAMGFISAYAHGGEARAGDLTFAALTLNEVLADSGLFRGQMPFQAVLEAMRQMDRVGAALDERVAATRGAERRRAQVLRTAVRERKTDVLLGEEASQALSARAPLFAAFAGTPEFAERLGQTPPVQSRLIRMAAHDARAMLEGHFGEPRSVDNGPVAAELLAP